MSVIGIVGTSYCGSTTLSRLFAAVPGVASVGECHWLLDDYRKIATEAHGANAPWCGYCATHENPACPELTNILKKTYSDHSLLFDIATELHAETLVVSEKAPSVYDRIFPEEGMDAVLLFRHPKGVIKSLMERDKISQQTANEVYVSFHRYTIDWCRAKCPKTIMVSFEALLMDPQGYFNKLCEALDLPSIALPSLGDIVYHHIYGNTQAHKRDALLPVEETMVGPEPSGEAIEMWMEMLMVSL